MVIGISGLQGCRALDDLKPKTSGFRMVHQSLYIRRTPHPVIDMTLSLIATITGWSTQPVHHIPHGVASL